MFQNIQGQAHLADDYEENNKGYKIKNFINTAFTPGKILVYIASFMLSSINITSGFAPFAIAIFAACLSNQVPAIIVYVLTLLGTIIGLGSRSLSHIFVNITCVCCYDVNFQTKARYGI